MEMGSEIVCVFIETAGNFCPSAGAKTSEVQKGRCKRRQTMKLYLPKAAEKEKPRSRERERDERERERGRNRRVQFLINHNRAYFFQTHN